WLAGGGHASGARGRSIRGTDLCLRRLGFLGRERLSQFPFSKAAALPDFRRVGKPRRLNAFVGADADGLRGGGSGVRSTVAADAASECARRSGLGGRRLYALHPADVE